MPLTDTEVLQEQVDRLVDEVARLREDNKKLMIAQEAYAQILFGDKDSKGLVHTVKDINAKFDTFTKLAWVITGALVAQLVATVWSKL